MAITRFGEFKVEKIIDPHTKERIPYKANIFIKGNDSINIEEINNFIKDLGKYETIVNGASPLINIVGLSSENKIYKLVYEDFQEITEFGKDNGAFPMERYYLTITTKKEITTNKKKPFELSEIDEMIENIEKYHSLKNAIRLFKDEIIGE